ncbi:hypothetical protein DC487_15980 [Sphingobacterium corticibacter]|uniref:Uncharacterized protein n=1 Tax=Sphingobacterium corticibacter TaxID=2171749 RepID=A0A2T8HET3_9SPHI|nr:hypothetical protein DC487_15980 [Sphingobacterium corticibacter]
MDLNTKKINITKTLKKELYLSPVISVRHIIMESTFAAGSSRITPGGANSDFQPQVENWENIGGINGTIDA